jgi:hypothetical protein
MNSKEWHAKAAALRKENARFGPKLVEIPREHWPREGPQLAIWRSRDFLVQVFPEPDGVIRLSVNRTALNREGGWADGISWDELQSLKQQCGYGDRWAVEVYPSDGDIVCVSNMRHLWLLPGAPPYAWIRD